MTKRDYIKFAEMLREQYERANGSGEQYPEQTIARVQDSIADLFAADNPRFDRERFAKACEVKA
jgi:hypothetical protein